MPSLATPTAWLAPLPPGMMECRLVLTVRPGWGSSSTFKVTSILILPMTTIFLALWA